jgi:hypothetical protein
VDPSDARQLERFLAAKESREQEEEYLAGYHRHIAGGEIATVGFFATCVFVGYLDHEPLTVYWPRAALLWHPAVATSLFAACFAGYLGWRSWYAANPPAPDLAPGPGVRLGFWAPLGLALAALVLLGALTGLTACAAGVAVAAWLIAHRRTGGALWRPNTLVAKMLVPASVIPPLIGFPAPNLFAVFVLGVLGGVLFTTGCVMAVEYHRYVLRERNTREGSA